VEEAAVVIKVLYRPLGLGFSLAGGLLAGALFKQVWKLLAGEDDAPDATDEERGWGEVLAAAALQGAIFAVVKAAVDRGGAKGVRRLTGTWPAG
jgi:predicted metal-dependent enzyme (double-stranded beta helix superfamily)